MCKTVQRGAAVEQLRMWVTRTDDGRFVFVDAETGGYVSEGHVQAHGVPMKADLADVRHFVWELVESWWSLAGLDAAE